MCAGIFRQLCWIWINPLNPIQANGIETMRATCASEIAKF